MFSMLLVSVDAVGLLIHVHDVSQAAGIKARLVEEFSHI